MSKKSSCIQINETNLLVLTPAMVDLKFIYITVNEYEVYCTVGGQTFGPLLLTTEAATKLLEYMRNIG